MADLNIIPPSPVTQGEFPSLVAPTSSPVSGDQSFVATCGSGVTANSLIFAAHLLGNDATRLYDGSWSEWGADPATPKAVGPA